MGSTEELSLHNLRYSLVLRSPAGIVMDEVFIDHIMETSFSRDKDGYGVWRWGDESPGSSNGGSVHASVKELILSLAFSSIKEAWDEASQLFGFSFDTVIHFVQRSVDLFIERFVSLLSTLVVDVSLFIRIEIEDASGSAGGGIEVCLNAEGKAVSKFLEWIYHNIRILIMNIKDPENSGDLISFPTDILEMCSISLLIFSEVETPVSVSKFASEGSEVPDKLSIGTKLSINLALPMDLIGHDTGDWKVSFGVQVIEAPAAVVSIFYDMTTTTSVSNLWLVKGELWEL
jgi:hypothetical protein